MSSLCVTRTVREHPGLYGRTHHSTLCGLCCEPLTITRHVVLHVRSSLAIAFACSDACADVLEIELALSAMGGDA